MVPMTALDIQVSLRNQMANFSGFVHQHGCLWQPSILFYQIFEFVNWQIWVNIQTQIVTISCFTFLTGSLILYNDHYI